MKVKANQQGFTLIELVVVIVILGILAVTAAPKFIDLTGDAKGAVVKAVEASLNSVSDLAHAKALVRGNENDDMSIAGANISFVNGYPKAADIAKLMDVDTSVLSVSDSSGTVKYTYDNAANSVECIASYTNATSIAKPSITSDVDGC
jgi:MSHA pilin protein MshA